MTSRFSRLARTVSSATLCGLAVVVTSAPQSIAATGPGNQTGQVRQAQANSSPTSQLKATQAAAAALPTPFSDWHVTVRQRQGSPPGTLTVSYDSPAIGERTENTVFLPTRYTPSGAPSPTLYYLHGTVHTQLDNPVTNLPSPSPTTSLLNMASQGGGWKQTQIQDFPSQRDKANFLVVAPDTNPKHSFCETCLWTNGKNHLFPQLPPVTAKQVPAETFLYKELIPLTQALFNVRNDRGGRGVTGFSMGGASAYIQGFRHPDMWSYVAPISGGWDLSGTELGAVAIGVGWLRDQGYGTGVTEGTGLIKSPLWNNFNPSVIAPNFAGSGARLMISAGDICLPPTDQKGAQDCANRSPAVNPYAAVVEQMLRNNNDRSLTELPKYGIDAQQVRFSGVHGANNHRVYSEVIVPGANYTFAHPAMPALSFFYRTVYPQFSIWNYRVAVHRKAPEFLTLENARHDGRSFDVRGGGVVSVTTPTKFTPNETYTVTTYSSDERAVAHSTVRATNDGRLAVTANLDDPSYSRPTATINLGREQQNARLARVRIVSR